MSRRWFSVLMCSLLTQAASYADEKPNFSGSWKLNVTRSEFGPMPKPERYEAKVEHKDPELKVATTQASEAGERTMEATFLTDGTETTNKMGPAEVKSKARWEGKTLLIDSTLDVQGNEIAMSEKWALADDGGSFIIDRVLRAPQGDIQFKYVLEKQ